MEESIEMEEDKAEGNSGKVVVYLCECRGEISNHIDLKSASERISQLPFVGSVRIHEALCSEEGRSWLRNDLKEHSGQRAVIGACSSDIQQNMFARELEEAGLNKYLSEQIDLRELCAWVHPEKDKATDKAVSLINGGIRKIITLEPAEDLTFSLEQATLVIGGGLSGMWAALQIAEAGVRVYLVERTGVLGGDAATADMISRVAEPGDSEIAIPTTDDIHRVKEIEIFLNSEVEEINGIFGNRKVKLSTPSGMRKLSVGTIVLAMDQGFLEKSKKVADMLSIVIYDKSAMRIDEISSALNNRGICVIEFTGDHGDVVSSIEEAKSTVTQLIKIMRDGTVQLPRIIAKVDEWRCRGCGRCKEVCEFGAITLVKIEEDEQIAKIDEKLCEGCGSCTFACCNGAMELTVYGADQMMENMIGMIEVVRS